MANIAEGHGRKSNIEFANFLNIARGSAAEVMYLFIANRDIENDIGSCKRFTRVKKLKTAHVHRSFRTLAL